MSYRAEGRALTMRSLCAPCIPLHRCGIWDWCFALASLFGCAVSMSPAAPHAPTLSPPLALAFAYFQNGQNRVALDESRKVLETQPDEPQALGLQGLIYARLNDPALAGRSFFRAEQGAAQDADLAHNHGLFLFEQNQFSAAFERFSCAVQQPLYAYKSKTFWVWGVCVQKSGNEVAAQSLWRQSLALKPSAEAALALALSYQQQSHTVRANEVLARINSTPAATPETLWLGIQWALKNANEASFKRYAVQLQMRFPTSSQWDAFQREAYDD
jgi:type IV pilus assembly protein PilF